MGFVEAGLVVFAEVAAGNASELNLLPGIELEVVLHIREFSFGPLGFVPLGFGSLNHGFWPSLRVFGTQNLRVQTLRVQT